LGKKGGQSTYHNELAGKRGGGDFKNGGREQKKSKFLVAAGSFLTKGKKRGKIESGVEMLPSVQKEEGRKKQQKEGEGGRKAPRDEKRILMQKTPKENQGLFPERKGGKLGDRETKRKKE